jgi:hypothetical protein
MITERNDGHRGGQRQQRLPAVPVGQVADHRRQDQRAQASNLKQTRMFQNSELELRFRLRPSLDPEKFAKEQ